MTTHTEEYLGKIGVQYKAHLVEGPTVTAQDAAAQLHVPLKMIVKTVVFVDEKNSAKLAVLTGDRRVDKSKLSAVLGAHKVRIASPEDTKTLTGFDAGVVPPIGHEANIQTVIDLEVMKLNRVYGGSGMSKTLIEIDPRDVARLSHARLADICKIE